MLLSLERGVRTGGEREGERTSEMKVEGEGLYEEEEGRRGRGGVNRFSTVMVGLSPSPLVYLYVVSTIGLECFRNLLNLLLSGVVVSFFDCFFSNCASALHARETSLGSSGFGREEEAKEEEKDEEDGTGREKERELGAGWELLMMDLCGVTRLIGRCELVPYTCGLCTSVSQSSSLPSNSIALALLLPPPPPPPLLAPLDLPLPLPLPPPLVARLPLVGAFLIGASLTVVVVRVVLVVLVTLLVALLGRSSSDPENDLLYSSSLKSSSTASSSGAMKGSVRSYPSSPS